MSHYVPFDKAQSRISLIMSMLAQGFDRGEIVNLFTERGIPGVGKSGKWDIDAVETAEDRWGKSGLPVDESADVFFLLAELPWQVTELPELDWTDGGFNWTPEELSWAAELANRLVRHQAQSELGNFNALIRRYDRELFAD